MVEMLDYRYHYAVMATEDRVRDAQGRRAPANARGGRPHLRLPRLGGRARS